MVRARASFCLSVAESQVSSPASMSSKRATVKLVLSLTSSRVKFLRRRSCETRLERVVSSGSLIFQKFCFSTCLELHSYLNVAQLDLKRA